MRRGGEQDQVAGWVLRQGGQELEALLPAPVRADASVRFINDNEGWTCAGEALAPPVALDVVQTDDRERVGVEEGLRNGQAALQSRCRGCGDRGGVEVELRFEFVGPLFDEMGRRFPVYRWKVPPLERIRPF